MDAAASERIERAVRWAERQIQAGSDRPYRAAPAASPMLFARVTSATADADGNFPAVITYPVAVGRWEDAAVACKLWLARGGTPAAGTVYECTYAPRNAAGEDVYVTASCCTSAATAGCVTDCAACPAGMPARWALDSFVGPVSCYSGMVTLDHYAGCEFRYRPDDGCEYTLYRDPDSPASWVLNVVDSGTLYTRYRLDPNTPWRCCGPNTFFAESQWTYDTNGVPVYVYQDAKGLALTVVPLDDACAACAPCPCPPSLCFAFALGGVSCASGTQPNGTYTLTGADTGCTWDGRVAGVPDATTGKASLSASGTRAALSVWSSAGTAAYYCDSWGCAGGLFLLASPTGLANACGWPASLAVTTAPCGGSGSGTGTCCAGACGGPGVAATLTATVTAKAGCYAGLPGTLTFGCVDDGIGGHAYTSTTPVGTYCGSDSTMAVECVGGVPTLFLSSSDTGSAPCSPYSAAGILCVAPQPGYTCSPFSAVYHVDDGHGNTCTITAVE